jgi:hypothetical protein
MTPEQRAEYMRLKRQDMRDFREAWAEEQVAFGGWVPAHMLTVTGIILRELVEDGKVETDGYGYRPA